MLAVAVVLGVIAAGQAVYIATRPRPVAIFDYPTQKVLFATGAEVTVRGTKCSTAQAPVKLAQVTSWVSVDPPGTVIDVSRAAVTRKPGCRTREYHNPVPAAVTARTAAIAASSGAPCVAWRITGVETPSDPNILPGTWTTEPFDLCP